MNETRELSLVQIFPGDKWLTLTVSSFAPDAQAMFDLLKTSELITDPVRLVKVTVDDYDCILAHARDFVVEARANFGG